MSTPPQDPLSLWAVVCGYLADLSSDDVVAMVDESGLVTGVSEGQATITAAAEGKEGSAAITVEAALAACTASVSAPGVTPCGIVVGISPFATGGPFGGFQSDPGTGASSTIGVTFSGPVRSVGVTAFDPDFAGNRVEAYNAAGSLVAFQNFAIDNTPGVFTASNVTVTASGIVRVLLIPGAADFVAYGGLTFTTDPGP